MDLQYYNEVQYKVYSYWQEKKIPALGKSRLPTFSAKKRARSPDEVINLVR